MIEGQSMVDCTIPVLTSAEQVSLDKVTKRFASTLTAPMMVHTGTP